MLIKEGPQHDGSGTNAEIVQTGATQYNNHIGSSADNKGQPVCTFELACSKRSDSNDSNFFCVGRYGDLALRLGSGIPRTAVYT